MRLKYTKELLEPVIRNSINWAQVCRGIGKKPATGSQTHVKKRAVDFGIDFSHFTGNTFNKGRVFGPKNPIEVYLKNELPIGSHALKLKLFREGIKQEKCERCGLSEWQGEKIVLELDHVNENHFDNSLNNLKVLCSLCHALKTRNARMAKKKTRHA